METIIQVKALDNYKIWIKFADKYENQINIQPFINTGMSLELLDKTYFKSVKLDDMGGITWPNGFDFCPNFLRNLPLYPNIPKIPTNPNSDNIGLH